MKASGIRTKTHTTNQSILALSSKEKHLQSLIKNAKSVCEYINALDYYSSTSKGEQLLSNDGVILSVFIPKRDIFMPHRDEIQANPDKECSDFQELYSLKTLSKLDLFGNKMRVGNCGEKVAQAFLNLIKYYPEEIRSIEEVRIADHQKEIDHLFLVLNRDSSDIQADPMNWRPVDDQTDVLIVDPSFNAVFFAREYQGKLMMYEKGQIEYSEKYGCETVKNDYFPYCTDSGKYSVTTHKRFETKNPNRYFLEYMKDHNDQHPEMLEIKRKEKEFRNQFQLWVSEERRISEEKKKESQ